MNSPGFHEVHIFCTIEDLDKLELLSNSLSDLHINTNCDPKNIPLGTLCYEYPLGREQELDLAARAVGLAIEWGIVGSNWVAVFGVGDYLYGISDSDSLFKIWDIQDPSAPTAPGSSINLSHQPSGLSLFDSVAYVSCADGSIIVINVDDPATPVVVTTATSNENWEHIHVTGSTIWVSGSSSSGIGIFDISTTPPKLLQLFNNGGGTSQVAVQGTRVFFADATGGKLSNYDNGGFSCKFVSFGDLLADYIRTEGIRARYGHFKGVLEATELSVMGAELETDTGELTAPNYIKLGTKFFFWSDSIADPNATITATKSSIFLASDGTVWRNTDGAQAWSSM